VAKHIGIVAVSPEGSGLCYREIFRHASRLIGDTGHPCVTLHNEPLELYLHAALRSDWHTVSGLLRKSSDVLAAAGAEFCITPDNLMQNGVPLAEVGCRIPWLTMTDAVSAAVAGDGRKVVGLIGTKLVMLGSTYQTRLGMKGVQLLVPDEAESEAIDSIIFRELVHGIVRAASQRRVLDVLRSLAARGCEGVILGCTEAPLLVTAENAPLPVYDSTTLLAEAAVRYSVGKH
jgi:aspartate racemase